MAKNKDSKYTVGYKKPPLHTQFKPGQSGNVKGRPKKSTSLVDAFLKELRTPVAITEGTKTKRMQKTEVIAKQITNMAAKGDPKATALLLNALKRAENGQGDNLHELLQEFREKSALHNVSESKEDRATSAGSSDPTTSPTSPKSSEP